MRGPRPRSPPARTSPTPGRRAAGSARASAAPSPPSARSARAACRGRPCAARMTNEPELVDRAGDDLVAGLLGHRHRLAGHHRFVDRRSGLRSPRRRPACSRPAARAGDRRPRPRRARRPRRCRRSSTRRAVFGCKVEQRADRAGGRFAGAQLQHLPEQHQHGDDGGGLEIDRDRAVMAAERRRETGRARASRPRCRHRRRRCRARSA